MYDIECKIRSITTWLIVPQRDRDSYAASAKKERLFSQSKESLQETTIA